MSVRNILLAVSGGLVLIMVVALFMGVRAAPAKPDPVKVQEALAKYNRTKTAPSASNVDDPWARSPSVPAETREPRFGADTGRPAAEPAPDFEPPSPPTVAPMPDVANDPRLDVSNAKDEANRMYDKQDYEGAMAKALEVLANEPGDIRMLRVVVSSSCQLGDADKAKQYWELLPPHDQNQMNRRCQRFGITFAEQ